MVNRVLFLGGNGHCAARLGPAREALARTGNPFELIDVPYPGFEGRPRERALESFLDRIGEFTNLHANEAMVYATGIGGLIALALRARGTHATTPILMQAPVLWGLERRWFPWLMRRGLWRLFPMVLRSLRFQRRFARTKFTRPPTLELLAAFFDGYQLCEASTDFFHWLTPALLRKLERDLAATPDSLDRINYWWGGRDAVVSTEELRLTELALGRTWPLRMFPHWGHYPMIDEPDEWIRSLGDELAAAV